MSLGDLFYNPASSTNYDASLDAWLKQTGYGVQGDNGFSQYTPQDNPFLASAPINYMAPYAGPDSSPPPNNTLYNISGDSFSADNYDQFLRQHYNIPDSVTHAQLQQFFDSPQGQQVMTSPATGWKEDFQPLAQAVGQAIAMYFGGPAAIAGSIAAGGATTAGASPGASAAIGALAGSGEGLTGAGQTAGAAAAGDSAAVNNGEFGTTFGGTSGSSGSSMNLGNFGVDQNSSSAAGGSIQGSGGGGGGGSGGGQMYYDDYGNPMDFTPSETPVTPPPSSDGGAFDMYGSAAQPGSSSTIFDGSPSSQSMLDALSNKLGISSDSLLKTFGSQGIAKLIGSLFSSGLGAYAANQQSNALSDLSNQYLALGAPSRARYEASFAPGFTMANDPGYTDALNQSAKSVLHGLSVGGNPAESPDAWNKSLSDINSQFAYPALQNYRAMNSGVGGISSLTGAVPSTAVGSINAGANVYNALGAGAADIFNPPKSLADVLKSIKVSA